MLKPLLWAALAVALPDAKTLMDRHLAACGGREALKQVKTLTIRGKLILAAEGITGKTTVYQTADGESYHLVEMPGAGKMEAGNNGDVEWERSTVMGPNVKRIAVQPGDLLDPSPLMEAYWEIPYRKAETVGTDTVDGKPCYKVALTPETGSGKLTQCYDQSSGLLVRTTTAAADGQQSRLVALTLRDYRAVGPLKTAFGMETQVFGQTVRIEIEEVKLNESLPPGVFDVPDDIQKLVAKRQRPFSQAPPQDDPDRPRLKRKAAKKR